MTIKRRQGREWALQMLVQFDLDAPASVDAAIAAFWDQQTQLEAEALEEGARDAHRILSSLKPRTVAVVAELRAFAEARVRGVWAARAALDVDIEQMLENWSFYRLGTVERNALRLGAWELLNTDIPAPIVINEAVDVAKYFSDTRSGRFVNGILDRMAKRRRAESRPEAAEEPAR